MGSAREDRSKETSLWQWLKRAADKMGPRRADVQRIEDTTKTGTPDVEGFVDGGQFWCELKVAHEMAGGRWRVKLTTAQFHAARRRRRAGGLSWVLVRVGSHPCRHYLVDGLLSEELHERAEPVTEARLLELSTSLAEADAGKLLKTMADRR